MAALIDPYGNKKTVQTSSTSGSRTFSTQNLNQPKAPAAAQAQPYQGGLQNTFDPLKPGTSNGWDSNKYINAQDSDVRGAQQANYFLGAGYNAGVDSAEQKALLNMYQTRINQKNSLAEAIAGAEGSRKNMVDQIYGESGRALGEGLKKTKENYSSRGLLYSGMREGSEQNLRSGIAQKTASDVANTNRESANSLESAKRAYASVGLANAQENIQLANQAFENANANSIARLQAYQQFGQGAGALAGYAYGSRGDTTSSGGSNVNANYRADQAGVGGRQGLLGAY